MNQNPSVVDYKSLMETALLKLEKLQSKLAAVQQQSIEPIAIIGMGCRFPAAPDPHTCWRLLSQGEDAIQEVPSNRWDLSRYYDPDPDAPGKTYTRAGGFLEKIDQFDPAFFGISPREALTLDPQHRLLLEVSWQALEHAGLAPESLENSLTGVFIGISSHDYADYLAGQMISEGDLSQIDAYVGTGNTDSVAAGRISYFLGTQGPSLAVDTACSSSLVALHLACQSLRQKECHLALAGGVNILLSPAITVNFSKAGMLSVDGRCKTFDAAADGYGRSEGCGVVVLKRLSDAQQDGDPILAVIRGSAVNQDGPSGGLTVPNGPAQEAVIRQALANGKVDPALVDYIEAHGTGTSLGDPIEVGALGSVFTSSHNRSEHPLWVGSIKTNIGHSEAAAGIAGVIKVILALQHEQMPAHLHFQTPNPHIPWDELPIQVVREAQAWPRGEKPRVAGISSFGFSGTNAHVVIQEAPLPTAYTPSEIERPLHPLTLSAKTSEALTELAHKYVAFLRQTELDLGDICLTANTGRSHFIHRLVAVADHQETMAAALQDWLEGTETPMVTSGRVQGSTPRIGFLFTGQGSQYVDMGRELYETQPTFKQALDRCAQILDTYLDQPLVQVIYAEGDSPLSETAYTQPALFALEYSLAQLWMSWGIQPQILMGHSVGEYVAACLAGVFSLEDGLKLIAERARLMQSLSSDGGMVSALTDPDTVQAAIAGYPDRVSIAAYNGPESVVFSGERQAVEAVAKDLETQGIKVKPLEVSQAFHSPLMEPMLKEFEAIARQVKFASPRIPIISNVSGELASEEIATPEYWVNHVRQPVKFAQGMQALQQQGVGIYLEVGPKPILLGMGRQCLTEDQGIWLPSLRPGQSDWTQILQSLSQLYALGVKVNWPTFDQDYRRQRLADLPTYPFQRQRYWVEKAQPDSEQISLPSQVLSPVVQDLLQGNVAHLKELLVQSGQFSPEQEPIIAAALQLLVDQHQEHLKAKSKVVYDYYNALASFTAGLDTTTALDSHFEENFVTFGPFPEILEGFSWIRVFTTPQEFPDFVLLSRRVQKEMRAILFRLVDFSRCRAVLDFGCGYASDLVALAERYPHLQLLHGYTISSQQAQVGMDKVRAHQLEERAQIFNRDSAVDEYPAHYDLVFGFEVAHHILNKTALFANIGRHIHEQGYLVLADFISNAGFTIEHYESSSFFITREEWVEHLSNNQLQVVECIDISREIANFLYDPRFEEHLNLIYQINHDDNVREGFRSYNQLGGLLRKGLASYILLTARKQSSLADADLRQWNRHHLQELVPYSLRSPQQWLYKLNWVSSSHANTSHVAPGQWLIFADQHGVAEELAAALRAAGHHSILVYRGEHCEQIQENQWRIRLAEWQDYQHVLTGGPQSWQGIVHLWSLDSQDVEDLRASDLLEAQHLGCRSVLLLVQALAKLQDDAVRSGLWLITRGAQAGEDSSASVQVQQASLWGLGRVIGVEYPEWSCHLVDLDPQDSATQQAQQLQQELITADAETQVRYQQGQRYAARFQRVWYPQTSEPLPVNENSTYLITGGLGALGLQLSQWLAEQGAKHLVLTARRSATEAAQAVLDRLQQQGVQIRVVLGDITQAVDVEKIFQELSVSMPPLKGIIHAAGTLEDGLIFQQNWEQFEKVMAPKILGSWFLHQYTCTLPLDFFVCFSSVAALLGSAGQGNYAAANAFMDALAHYRRGQDLAGLSLNWGPWAELGMAARLDQQQQETMAAAGMGLIPVAQGVEILGDLLRTGQGPQLAVLAMDWGKALPSNVPPLFSDLGLGTREAVSSDPLQTEKNDLLSSLQQAIGVARQELLVSYLQQTTATVLGFASDQSPDPMLGFFDMGIDSLLAVELRNRLQRDLEIRLASTLLFKYPTIQDLAEYLASQLDPVAHRFEEEPSVSSSSSATADSTETTLEQELLALQDLLRSDS